MPIHRMSAGRALAAAAALGCAFAELSAPGRAAGDAALRSKILAAFAKVKGYHLTVLGSVRSSGVFVAPDKYEVTTEIDGQPVHTVILGGTYWIQNADGKGWTKSGTTSSLSADIAGVVRIAKAHPGDAFKPLPDQQQGGKTVGTFEFDSADGNSDVCNYDRSTYLVTRCRQDELTILYSGYNDPNLKVATPTS